MCSTARKGRAKTGDATSRETERQVSESRRYRRTANEGQVRIQYKCLVPIYVFPEMNLWGLVISKTDL
jgi:hypothetical protein